MSLESEFSNQCLETVQLFRSLKFININWKEDSIFRFFVIKNLIQIMETA